MKYALKVVI